MWTKPLAAPAPQAPAAPVAVSHRATAANAPRCGIRRRLAEGASIELAPRQIADVTGLTEHLRPGTDVYVPFPPKADWRDSVAACRRLRQAGLRPVPHLAARGIASERDLDERLAQLAAAGVDALLLIAGDRARPAGPFQDSLAILDSGRLAAHGFARLCCAAHPERHVHADADTLRAALERKLAYARQTNTELTLVTQFAFAPAPILDWLGDLEASDAAVSVRVGLPAPARLRTLIKFAARCGIGASTKALTQRPGVVRLLGAWSPDRLMDALVEHSAQTPASTIAGIHLFPFGGLASASEWLRRQAALDGEGGDERMASAHASPSIAGARDAPALAPERLLDPSTASDGDIAASVPLRPIESLARERFGAVADALIPYGHHKAKLPLEALSAAKERSTGKLVLVTAISPTPAGEGKTTTSIGLVDALNRLGANAVACLREPSLGPCFGMKGGATGGGWSQIAPMADINLHFNGDLHAVTAAHNLLATLLDNHLYWGNAQGIDLAAATWRRVLDLNDRALRDLELPVGGGQTRRTGFDITAASEVMAVLCLAQDLQDLERRLGQIVVARRTDGSAVTAQDLDAAGALTALLRDALQPNLVQTLAGNPAFVHGGPFANIAHGCNTVAATRAALALSDIVVTEAGFGADLGAEKFLNIKCRQSGLWPHAAVLVCTVRALKLHGGADLADLATPNVAAVQAGAPNLARHIANLKRFGLTPLVAINRFPSDAADELAAIEAIAQAHGAKAIAATHWRDGGAGAEDLAHGVLEELAADAPRTNLLYPNDMALADKLNTVATALYGAAGIDLTPAAQRQLAEFEALGYGHLPVCVAKTQYSFSADAKARGAPSGHVLPVREARLCAGAGFVVAICGNIMTMPGLPRRPAAHDIGVAADGRVVGL